MAVTGILMAYERQIVALAERGVATVTLPATGAVPLRPEALVAKLAQAFPDAQPSALAFRRDPTASVTASFGRERTIFVDPYTGAVLGEGSRLRPFFHQVEHLHRDLALGPQGRWITGACSLAFLAMVLSGLYLWLPRKWTRKTLGPITTPSFKLRGKARDWNWHNAVGLWSAPFLLVAIITGVVMAYPWANNLLFRLTGNEPPPPRTASKGEGPRREPARFDFLNFDQRLAVAEQKVTDWQTINARLPESAGGALTFVIEEGATPDKRSQLTLNAKTGAVQRWEPFASYNLGRQLRMWTKPVHTGEALGIAGQTLAALAAAGACLLVWTGFALSWRRFRNRPSGIQPGQQAVDSSSDALQPAICLEADTHSPRQYSNPL
jgi:uncharacterized iron-regulated membrane protein